MGINRIYVLTEEELKELLRQQQLIDESIDWTAKIGMKEEDTMPELPPILSEWGMVGKIFNKKSK